VFLSSEVHALTAYVVVLLLGLPGSTFPVISAQQGPNLYPEPFVDVSLEAGIAATHRGEWDQFNPQFTSGYLGIGQAWGDYDNDGWIDLYVTGNTDDNVLYQNNGDGTFRISEFSEQVSAPGILSGGTVWADYDNDGWLDLYVVNYGPNNLYHNQQGQGFVDVAQQVGIHHTGKGTSATWGDYDKDGNLDLYVGNWSCYPECGEPGEQENTLAQDVLYRNNGDGSFTDVSHLLRYEKLLGSAFAVSFVDYDNDADVDIYVANDMLKNPIGNVLWRNDGPGCDGWCWTDASVEARADIHTYAMGLAVGDYNNDLTQDFYFTNIVNPMTLLQNQGDGTFTDATRGSGVGIGPSPAVGWGTAFFDYNNDGWLDLFVASTQFVESKSRGPGGAYLPPEALLDPFPNALFQNNGDGTFSDAAPPRWGWDRHATMGIAYADYDNDGWVDFVLGNWNEGYALYRNTAAESEDHHWLTLRLVGAGSVNRDAVGSRVFVTTADGRTQMQEVICGSGLGAGNELALHFGAADMSIDLIQVVWPDGTESLQHDVPTNRIMRVTYPSNFETMYSDDMHP
jgi:hypothetical protein